MAYILSTDEEICSNIALLIKDTERRIVSARDVYTSGEIRRGDIYIAKKNLKELVLLMRDVEKSRLPMVENLSEKFGVAVGKISALQERVGELSTAVFGRDITEVSSLDGSYDHALISDSDAGSISFTSSMSDFSHGIPDYIARDRIGDYLFYRDFGIIKSENEGEDPSRVPKRNLGSAGIDKIGISPIKRVRTAAYNGSIERPDEPFTDKIL